MSMQSDHEFAPTQIAAADFPTAFRGFDQDAVRRYLTRLASALEEKGGDALAALARTTTLDRIEELEEENDSLRSEVRDLELELVQRSVDGPDQQRSRVTDGDGEDRLTFEDFESEFDEHRAIELLGKETARVLESARSASADIVKKAERQAKTIEKEARGEMTEARRKARRIVAEKQAEAEELVNKVAAEAEESASRLRTEAEQHREMVLSESKKIMTDAEAQAEADERWAQQRAEQIVADAEALRQQLLSELVVERTRVRTELEEMSTSRDRLVMALVVARSELDDMSQRLDTVTVPPAEVPADADSAAEIELDDGEAQAQVDQIVSDLDGQLPAIKQRSSGRSPRKRSSGRSKSSTAQKAAAGDDNPKDDEIDLTDDSDVIDSTDDKSDDSTSPAGGRRSGGTDGGSSRRTSGTESTGRNSTTNKTAKSRRKNRRRGTGSQPATGNDASMVGSATAVVDTASDDTLKAEAQTDEVLADRDGVVKPADVDESAEAVDTEAHGDDTAEQDIPEQHEYVSDVAEVDNLDVNDEEDGESGLTLIEGFNTIEMTESELGLSATGGEIVEDGDALDQVITTVVSRELGEHVDGNRGDLLMDEEYRGRLPSAISARDVALGKADEFHRSIRRALNDDQSEVLDRLRAGRGGIEVSELPRFSDQIERYLKPLRDGLAPVALAGAKAGGRREISAGVLDNLAKQLARYIVDKVRIPVIREVEHATHNDREKLFEPIRSIYRDFRNTGLLDLADDALYEAFAIGLYGAIAADSPVVWMLDPRHDPDPVCEINAGRDGVLKGQKFPSGHVRPLALPNCRCLVVPD